jgi:hypothetical protein
MSRDRAWRLLAAVANAGLCSRAEWAMLTA